MRLRMLIAIASVFLYAACACGAAQEPDGKKEGIARLAEKLEGTWAIEITTSQNEKRPSNDGKGQESFEQGPGHGSFVEKYHSTGTEGEISGLGIYWWNEATKTYRILWCDNQKAQGCTPMSGGGKWEGATLVLRNTYSANGKKMELKEVFSEFTGTSYVQRLYTRPEGGEWKLITTIRATRLGKR